MSEFDAAKAIREELQGLADVRKTITTAVTAAEMKMTAAEAEHNAAMKLLSFCDAEIARKREVLKGLT